MMRANLTLTCDDICARLELPSPGDPWPDVTGVSTLTEASRNDLCFVESADQFEAVSQAGAALVLAPQDFPEGAGVAVARVDHPRRAFFLIAELFRPPQDHGGVHADASIDPNAELQSDVTVAPGAVIGAGVVVGAGSYIGPCVYLAPNVHIGSHCRIHANVTLQRDSIVGDRCIIHSGTSIGGDGFGYEWDGEKHRKVPQLGRVVIGNDVEIGCNVCVDRATLGTTSIGDGAKIDNLVQIAHNVDIGAHVILVSQCGVAGSTRIGAGTVVAGQAAISDHLDIGAGSRIGGQAGVTKSVDAGAVITGTPARPLRAELREQAALGKLPEMVRELKRQQRRIEALESRLSQEEKSEKVK